MRVDLTAELDVCSEVLIDFTLDLVAPESVSLTFTSQVACSELCSAQAPRCVGYMYLPTTKRCWTSDRLEGPMLCGSDGCDYVTGLRMDL